ncbi:MAG: RidA family protein [Thaumarchaeota archaeon]|nr:RidA family protein [Nitrososphaerota archaeon]
MSRRKEVVIMKSGVPSTGPYSRAVKFGELVFVSGISPRNRDGTKFKGTVEEEVANVLENIARVLDDAGSSLERVLKVTVILGDERDWERMNSVYAKYFPKDPPARTTFHSDIGASVEMDAIAYV